MAWLGVSDSWALSAKAEGISGAGESASKMERSHGWQAGAGCWRGTLVPLQVSLSQGCLSVLTTWQLSWQMP